MKEIGNQLKTPARSSLKAVERLEPDDGKLSSPVLRRGSGSDVASLSDEITSYAVSNICLVRF